MDPTPKSPRRRRHLWLPLLGLVVCLGAGAGMGLWLLLPRYAPGWVIKRSIWIDPVVRSMAHEEVSVRFLGETLMVDLPGEPEAIALDLLGRQSTGRKLEDSPIYDVLVRSPELLTPYLLTGSPERREVAGLLLRGIASAAPCEPQIARALASRFPELRLEGLRAIARRRTPDAVDLLTGGLDDPDAAVRALALDVLGGVGPVPNAERVTIEGLGSAYPETRRRCAELTPGLTSLMPREAVVPKLKPLAMSDPSPTVRRAALEALGSPRLFALEHSHLLLHARTDLDAFVRKSARKLLELHYGWGVDMNPEARTALSKAIELGPPRERYGAFLWCTEEELTHGTWLLEGLGEQDPGIRTALLEWLADPPYRRLAVSRGWLVSSAPLLGLVQDPSTTAQLELCAALAGYADPAAIEALVSLSRDQDPLVRKRAVLWLGDVQTPDAVLAIAKARQDADLRVRIAAQRCLDEVPDDLLDSLGLEIALRRASHSHR